MVRMRYGSNETGEAITGTYSPSAETETLVWSNSSPTATFNGKDVTLSEPIADGTTPVVKGIRIVYARTNSASSAQYSLDIRFGSDLTDYMYASNGARWALSFNTADYRAYRAFGVVSDYVLHFVATAHSNSTSTFNTHLIPLEIYIIE